MVHSGSVGSSGVNYSWGNTIFIKMNKSGGGKNTNVNGLGFERTVNLKESADNMGILYMEKHELYKWLTSKGVNYKDHISKKLLPDGLIVKGNTVYVIEKKYQAGAGSVDEKLQTCDFKKKQYIRLLSTLNMEVEYWYILNDWFRQDCYKDVFNYIESVGCRYFFNDEFNLGEHLV
jgi:hypothetical protein